MRSISHYTFILLASLFLFSSCDRDERFKDKLVGEWQFESAEHANRWFGFDDASNEYDIEKIVFYDDNTLELFYSNDPQPFDGEWDNRYVQETTGFGDDATTTVRNRLEICIYRGSDISMVNYIDRINRSTLRFTDDKDVRTRWEFSR